MPLPANAPLFSLCQENAFDLLDQTKENVFLTGSAGSGKSFLIRYFLQNKERRKFPVVASTGAAAVLVGGRTFHSFFGLGILEGGWEKTVDRALEDRKVVKRMQEMDGFVLDEVSMIPAPAFRAAEAICRIARKVKLPWGGARVIAVGDFAQLPPVNTQGSEKEWAFLDDAWRRSALKPALLKRVLRSQDPDYVSVLNWIRVGIVNDEVRDYLNGRVQPDLAQDSIPRLFPHRATADQFNRKRLAEINSPLKEFETEYTGAPYAVEQLKKNAPIPERLHLKEGALVMIRINSPSLAFVNGSLGTITKMGNGILDIQLNNGRPVELEKHTFSILNADGLAVATAQNFPVTLSYATTIHKAQGATMDGMVCDLRGLWEPGQAYVALSRLRTGAGLRLVGWDEGSIRVDEAVMRFHEGLTLI